MIFYLFIPFGSFPQSFPFSLQSFSSVFSFAPDKRPENILDSEEIISGQQRLHTHTKGAFRPPGAKDSHICREILTKQTASSVGGGLSNESTLKANGALPRLLEGLLKIILKFTANDAERGPFEERKEDHRKRPA